MVHFIRSACEKLHYAQNQPFNSTCIHLSITEKRKNKKESKSGYIARNLIMKLKVLWESQDILIHYLLGGGVWGAGGCLCIYIYDEELINILLLLLFL